MSDVIRDVLIRVGIQKSQDLEPPDIRDAKQRIDEFTQSVKTTAETVGTTAQRQLDSVTKLAEKLEKEAKDTFVRMTQAATEAMAGIGKQEDAAEALLEKLGKQAAELDELKKLQIELNIQIKEEADAQREREKAQKDADRAAKEALKERDRAFRNLESIQKEAAAAQNDVVDGMLRLARAAALLSTSDKQAKELLQTLADFQAAVDIVKGVQSVYEGLTTTIALSSRVKEAEAIASAKQAAANTAVAASARAAAGATATQASATAGLTASATAGGGALAGFASLLNPVTIVAAIAAAEVFLLVRAMRQLKQSEQELQNTRLGIVNGDFMQGTLRRDFLDQAGNQLRGNRITSENSRDDELRQLLPDGQKLTAIDSEIDQARKRSQDLQDQYQKQYDIVSKLSQLRKDEGGRLVDEKFAAADDTWTEEGRLAALREAAELQSQVAAIDPQVDAQRETLPLLEQSREQIARALALTKEQYEVKKDLIAASQRELETQKETLATETERLNKEKERAESVGRQLGRVSQDDVDAARVAARKLASGQTLTEEDIAAADRLAFGGQSAAIESAAAQRRQQLDIDSVRQQLGFTSPEEQIRQSEQQQQQINALISQTNQQLNDAKQKQIDLQQETIKIVTDLTSALAAMDEQIQDIKENIKQYDKQG